ncbi:MAG: DUF488 family protein [Treponema sp.]|nr:DUF488 family protein [Treponema sp.]
MIRLRLKRVYEPADPEDGARFLVERLWPRGIGKERARLDGWLKDAAPSAELRSWYSHDTAKWTEFRDRYRAELSASPESIAPLRDAARAGLVTLVFAAKDPQHSSALVLKDFLEAEDPPP